MLGFKDPLTLDEGYPSNLGSYGSCEIPTHAKRIGLEPNLQKQEEKLGRYTSSPYVWHTKAMTALVEYGIKCLH